MREYGLTVLVAAAVTYLLTPLIRRFAIAVGAMHAARARDVHTEPVPLAGGLAMYLGLAAALLVASRLTHLSTVFMGTKVASGLLLAGGVVVVMGFVDDRWGLGAITKLAGQVAAGGILVWSGAFVAWLPFPGGGTLVLTSDEQTVLTILLVVVTINAVNFIDGLDGLAAGIVGIGAAAFFLYYYTLTKRLGLDDQTDPALASAILAGVCLGFLPHNFYPARIFMGDTGSMLLGLLLAYAPIASLASLDPKTLAGPSAYSGGTVNRFPEILPLLVPAIIMLIPYADLLLAVVRRTRAGQSPFSADKKHLQHRLLAIGHSHRASVLLMYLWAVLFAGTVVLLSIIRTKLLVLGLVTLAGGLVLLLASMPRLRPWNRRGQLRLAPDVAGPVPSAAPVPAGAVPAVASGVGAAPGRRRADRGTSLDRGLPVDRGLGMDRGAGVDRAASARPQAFGDPGSGDPVRGDGVYGDPLRGDPGRGDVAYGDPLRRDSGRGDVAYGDPLRGNAQYGDPLRADAAYGDSRPGRGNPGTGTPAPAETVPGPGSPAAPVAPADGGWAPDPLGGREPGQWYPGRTDPARTDPGGHSGQWYSGRPEPGQQDSGRWDSRPYDAGSRHAGAPDASFEDAGLEGPSLPDPGPQDAGPQDPGRQDPGPQDTGPQHAGPQDPGPQDLDPLTPDPDRSQPPRPGQAPRAHPDANEYSEQEEESPLLPWRLH